MIKPGTLGGYSDRYTLDCERVLVTLLRGLGPWKESVYLVGANTVWQGSRCKIITKKQPTEADVGHEVMHCFQEHFH